MRHSPSIYRRFAVAMFATLLVSSSTIVAGVAGVATAIAPVTSTSRHLGGVTSHGSSLPIYTAPELYGDSNSSAVCYTCQASAITGTAPPSQSLDAGTGVDSLTGDFSTSNTLFSAPGRDQPFGITLTYDAQLAQAEVPSGTSAAGPFGFGWSSNFSNTVTPFGSGVSATMVVNQGNGSQITFNQSPASGQSTSCPAGDYPTTNKYTFSSTYGASVHQWCALANVQGQLNDTSSGGVAYRVKGGISSTYFAWNGTPVVQYPITNSTPTVFYFYNVAPGATPSNDPGTQPCPATANHCTILVSDDGVRDIIEVFNANGQVTEVIDPAGVTYTLSYDTHDNLITIAKYANQASPSTWNYVYDGTAPSPNVSDLVQVYDPDATPATPPVFSSGAAHSTAITYNNTGTDIGMVSSLNDGTGATTTYAYSSGCATGACVGATGVQQTTVTYPAQVPCPSCAARSPVEVENYVAGVQTSTTLGLPSNPSMNETWQYNWTMGYGASNSTEVITYPSTLSGVAKTATVTLDQAGYVISTTNALGEVATSAYNDVGANNLPELLWSYPGASSNGPSSPPAGSYVYKYNFLGETLSMTDPMGNVTGYGYYEQSGLLCGVNPPTSPGLINCNGTGTGGPSGAPVGSTIFTYDAYGDVVNQTIDYHDTAAGADPQTTTSSYDVMGNQLWTIPPAGQGGVQNSANPFATSATFTPAGLPSTINQPDGLSDSYVYDAANNLVSVGNKNDSSMWMFKTTLYDGDNRACYQVQGYGQFGSSCSAASQAGSTSWTYVPGSTAVATMTDSNWNTTSYFYGDLAYPNSPTQVNDPNGTMTQYNAYDDYGNACVSGPVAPALGTSTQCAVLAGDTSTNFNALGAKTSSTDPSGNVTSYAYGNTSYPTSVTSITNPLAKTMSFTYDANGRQTRLTNPDGTSIAIGYDADSRVCTQSDNGNAYACGSGNGVAGVTAFTYNGAFDRTSMTSYAPSAHTTSYSYTTGQLMSTTDANAKTISYLYNYLGQVACQSYPVSTTATCGTLNAPATASATNTIVTKSYDSEGRLSSVSDWLGNATSYDYTLYWTPYTPTSITYPSSTGLSASYGYDNLGHVTSLSASSSVTPGTPIDDSWTYNADSQVAVSSINGATSNWQNYDQYGRVFQAATLATSTSNNNYTIATNGSITSDASPTGAVASYGYNTGSQLCWSANVSTSSTTCTSPPSGAPVSTNFTYTANGQRTSATTTIGVTTSTNTYGWNPYGQLCNTSPTSTPCGTTPTSGSSYTYNGDGLRSNSISAAPTVGTISGVGSLQQSSGAGASTLAVSPSQVGHALVLSVRVGSPTINVASVSGGGATWKKLTSAVDGADVELWLGTVVTAGPSTITLGFSGAIGLTGVELSSQEYASTTGSSTTWSADTANYSDNTSSSTSVTMPTLTPSGPGELYVGYARIASTGVAGSTSGFTYDVTTPNGNLFTFNPSVSGPVAPAASQTSAGTSLAVAVLLKASGPVGPSTATASTWDTVGGGSIPLNVNDASTTSGTTSNTSYLYGDLLFGGTAPIEQITTTSSGTSVSYLVSNQTGVQGVYSGNPSSLGAVQEMAIYSPYGIQALSSGSKVTPFGFQGSYTDSTGLIYLVNRYYDPSTDQFLSVDPLVDQTGQPYVFVNDNPLNATDPLGLLSTTRRIIVGHSIVTVTIDVSGQLAARRGSIAVGFNGVSFKLHGASETVGIGGGSIAIAQSGISVDPNGVKMTTSREYDVNFKNSELQVSVGVSISVRPQPPSYGWPPTIRKLGLVGVAVVAGRVIGGVIRGLAPVLSPL